MSSKEKPTLGVTLIKTRKRNIAAPLDPAAWSRFFWIMLVIWNLLLLLGALNRQTLTSLDTVTPFLRLSSQEGVHNLAQQNLMRGSAILTLFLQSLELFEENERKLAIFTALAFSQKLSGLPPETVCQPLLKDNLVGKGLVLSFITDLFKEYLIDNSLDDLIAILKRGKMEDNLLEFFPSAKHSPLLQSVRSPEAFSEHFTKAGIALLFEYNEKKIFEVKLKEMKSALS
ncbi:Basic leucine zipper and W2 domain-containing protein 2-like [Heracleum sosnowskyi]|uniref:Basic leucine zipper and W2 domain-containing protein 2-like n=1 Tax=Heracleum sosnowskyi TaxID=360622 RepID=A0AAD8LZK6_9APIA|nr:Basic leucine zipper and W2 domain-containing protein 2-like [Heracleum sosnowskyi]